MNAFEMVRVSMALQQPKHSYAQTCECGEKYAYRAYLGPDGRTQFTERCSTCDLKEEAHQ
jgi:hypothetical protein